MCFYRHLKYLWLRSDFRRQMMSIQMNKYNKNPTKKSLYKVNQRNLCDLLIFFFCFFEQMSIFLRRLTTLPLPKPCGFRSFNSTAPTSRMDEFFDQNKANEVMVTGRAWTAADLRRKVSFIEVLM